LIDKPLGLMISYGNRPQFYQSLVALAHHGSTREFESRIGYNDESREVIIRATVTSSPIHERAVFFWLIQDISQYRHNENARRELMRRLVSAQEDERRRISRDLHDRLGQELTGLTLGLKLLESDLPQGTRGRARLRDLQEAVSRLGHSAHELAVELRPSALDDLGLQSALEDLVHRWKARTSIPVDFHFAMRSDRRFPREVESTVYRVVQESLTNIARHAGASRVSVIVEYRDTVLMTIIEDDGRGFDQETLNQSNHLGISGMHERLALVGGTLQVESSGTTGTTIRARVRCP
jgi:signal transduction histidine kinase